MQGCFQGAGNGCDAKLFSATYIFVGCIFLKDTSIRCGSVTFYSGLLDLIELK